MIRSITRRLSAFVLLAGFSVAAQAALVQGDYLGTFAGNDKADVVSAEVNQLVMELAKVDLPDLSSDGLAISSLTLDSDGDPTSGEWSYTGPGTVAYIVIKAGNMHAVYHYTDANNGGMPNMGIWNTDDVDGKGLSHITAYAVVPLPGAVWLLGSALFGAGLFRRRRHA